MGALAYRPLMGDPGHGDVYVIIGVADQHPRMLGIAQPGGHAVSDLPPLRIRESPTQSAVAWWLCRPWSTGSESRQVLSPWY